LLRTRIHVTKAYLFGSHVEGRIHEDSDIDIAVFSPAADDIKFEAKVDLIVNIEKQMNAPVELHLFGTKASQRRALPIFSVTLYPRQADQLICLSSHAFLFPCQANETSSILSGNSWSLLWLLVR
jgi:predicted nucleotidyltransferase